MKPTLAQANYLLLEIVASLDLNKLELTDEVYTTALENLQNGAFIRAVYILARTKSNIWSFSDLTTEQDIALSEVENKFSELFK